MPLCANCGFTFTTSKEEKEHTQNCTTSEDSRKMHSDRCAEALVELAPDFYSRVDDPDNQPPYDPNKIYRLRLITCLSLAYLLLALALSFVMTQCLVLLLSLLASYTQCLLHSVFVTLSVSCTQCLLHSVPLTLTVSCTQCLLHSVSLTLTVSYTQSILHSLPLTLIPFTLTVYCL